MPEFDYQCGCGLRFSAVAAMKDHGKGKGCPACGAMAPRHLPADLKGTFNLTTNGIGPQNTGVTHTDASIDRVIGADAAKGWAHVEGRNKTKADVLRAAKGKTSLDLSANPDGSYRVMTEAEARIHARAVTINQKAGEALKGKV